MREDHVERAPNRGNSKQLYTQRARLDVRKCSFGVRTAQIWNSLPEKVVSAKTLNSFKNQLDKWWKHQDIVYNYKACLITGTKTKVNEESSEEDHAEPVLENYAK